MGAGGAFDRRKHPAVAGAGGAVGCVRSCWLRWWCSFILSGLMFPGGVAAVAGVPVGSCLRFFLLYAFYTLPCLVFLPNIWKKFKPGGGWCSGRRGVLSSCRGWCSVFVEKTNKEKKTRKRVKIFIKSVDTDTGAC